MYGPCACSDLGRALAGAFLAGVWNEHAMVRRAATTLDPRPRWLRDLTRAVLAAYARPPSDRPRELAAFIAATIAALPQRDPYSAAHATRATVAVRASISGATPEPPRVRRWIVPEPAMGKMRWPVPPLASLADLAAFFELSNGHLEWLADARGLERTVADERLRNYRYHWLPRAGGAVRVIERPKRGLKEIQRRLLRDVLSEVPPHPAAHGFVRGRSARSHAVQHVAQPVVLRIDLEDFFASIEAGRIYGIFRTCGYPEAVAHTLTALTTNVIPAREWAALPRPREDMRAITAPHALGRRLATPHLRAITAHHALGRRLATPHLRAITAHHALGRRLATPHLPQGAPTSPALANLAAFGLDRRLAGLAASLGAVYTRYADDLTFSGPSPALLGDARLWIATIAREEGFTVNEHKTAVMSSTGRQRVCAIVVNERTNIARDEYDVLKAILHNAALDGPAAQNRAGVPDFRAHLLGRIAWVESLNPTRGAALRQRFERIAWD